MQMVGSLFSNKLEGASNIGSAHCHTGLFYRIVLDTFPIFIMVALYETIIYPLLKVCIPSMLKRIGIGMVVAIAGLLVLLAMDVYGYNQLINNQTALPNVSNMSLSCYLVNSSIEQQVDINVHVISFVMLLAAVAETLIFIAGRYNYVCGASLLQCAQHGSSPLECISHECEYVCSVKICCFPRKLGIGYHCNL